MQDLIFKALKAARDGKTDKELMAMAGEIEAARHATINNISVKVQGEMIDEQKL
jgi:hypothetical protein